MAESITSMAESITRSLQNAKVMLREKQGETAEKLFTAGCGDTQIPPHHQK